MYRRLLVAALALAGFVLIAQPASAQRFIRRGVFVTPYYGYGYWGPGWYGPGYPYWGGYYYAPHSNTGEVKIDTKAKDISVYVDGGYAGVTGKLKHFNLSPGNHDIELRDPTGRTTFQQRVQIIVGRTTEIRPTA